VITEKNSVQSAMDMNCHHLHHLHTSHSTSQSVDMSAVCLPGPAYYPQPLYVFTHVPPTTPIIYPGGSMSSASMVASPVLTTAGYVTSLSAHIMPQHIMMPPSLLPQPAHAGGLVLSSIIEQAPSCSIAVPRTVLATPAGTVIPPSGYVPQGYVTASSSKPAVMVGGLPVKVFSEHSTFSAPSGILEHVCMTEMNVEAKMQCSFQIPVINATHENVLLGQQPVYNHHMSDSEDSTSVLVQENNDSLTFETPELKHPVLNGGDIVHSESTAESVALPSYVESAGHFNLMNENVAIRVTGNSSGDEVSHDSSAALVCDSLSISSTAYPASNQQFEELMPSLHDVNADFSDDGASGGVLSMEETSQWPTIGQASSPVTAASSPLAQKSKTQTWASLLKDTTTATNAIVINSSGQQMLSSKPTDIKLVETKAFHAVDRMAAKSLLCVEAAKREIAGMYNSVHVVTYFYR
jgi:hypothetical protein